MQFFRFLTNVVESESSIPIKQEDFISKIIPNFWSFLTQFLALVVLLVVVVFVAYKPVKKMLEKRQEYIQNNISEAEKARVEAIEAANEAKNLVLVSKKEANEILENASIEANKLHEQSIAKTNEEISLMKSRAQEDIERAKEEAKDEIRKEIVSVALTASSSILKREVTSEDNTKLVEQFIEDIE